MHALMISIAAVLAIFLHVIQAGEPYKYYWCGTRSGYLFSRQPTEIAYDSAFHCLSRTSAKTPCTGISYGLLGAVNMRNMRLLVSILERELVGTIREKRIWRAKRVELLPESSVGYLDKQFMITALWTMEGNWYYEEGSVGILDGGNEEYLANRHLRDVLLKGDPKTSPKVQEDYESLVVRAIAGHVGIVQVPGSNLKICVINRLSTDRLGVATYVHGLNAEGRSANFMQSQLLLETTEKGAKTKTAIFQVLRGTPPVVYTRGPYGVNPDSSSSKQIGAFKKHISLTKTTHIIDLLDSGKTGENQLYKAFKDNVEKSGISLKVQSLSDFMPKFRETAAKKGLLERAWGWATQATGYSNPLRDFLDQVPLPEPLDKYVIRVHCIDSVGSTDEGVCAMMSKAVGPLLKGMGLQPQSLVKGASAKLQEIFSESKKSLAKIYMGWGVAVSMTARIQQEAIDAIYGKHVSEELEKQSMLNVPKEKSVVPEAIPFQEKKLEPQSQAKAPPKAPAGQSKPQPSAQQPTKTPVKSK